MDRVLVLEDHGTFRGRPLLRLGRGASFGIPGGGKDTGESDKGGGAPPSLALGTANPPGRGASSGFPGGGKGTGGSGKGGGFPPRLKLGDPPPPPPPSGIGQKGTVLERQVMVLVFGEV